MEQPAPPTRAQREFIFQRVGYDPTPEQWAIHLDTARSRLVIGGERAGKSLVSAMELLCWLIGRPDFLAWIVGPDYVQCRAEFAYILSALQKIGAVKEVSFPRIGACSLTTAFNGVCVTKTSDDVRKLAGTAPDGVLLVEAAQQTWEIFLKVRGRVAEKRGFILLSGTLEAGADWYPSLWQRWRAQNSDGGSAHSLPTWANKHIFPGGRQDPELLAISATLPADLFLERYGAIPCPPAGLVFREFSYEQHVREIAWRTYVKEPGMITGHHKDALAAGHDWPIEITVDPGYAHAYAVLALTWWGDQVYCFDEVYETGLVAEEVIARCKERWWWKRVTGGVIDIAGQQHPGAKSQVEIWRHTAGLNLRVNRVGIVEGILRTRTFFLNPATQQPRLFIAPKCKGLLAELAKYRYHKSVENRPVSELPIDRDNDACKALAYWLYDRFGPVLRKRRKTQDLGQPFAFGAGPSNAPEMTILPGNTPAGVRFGYNRAPAGPDLSFEVPHHE
jgi:hypothetical protein